MTYEFPFNTFPLVNKIRITNPASNLDARYGPWDSINIALSAFDPVLREIGLTVGVVENGQITEYWYKNNITDNGLVIKSIDVNLSTVVQSNSANWNDSYNITTEYQNASGNFVTDTDFSSYQTNVATSTATLLPISIYQNASGNWETAYQQTSANDLVRSNETFETPTTGISAIQNIVSLSQATYDTLNVKLPTTLYIIV